MEADNSGLGGNITRSRPETRRPKEWTEHDHVLQNSKEPSKTESTEKKNLWQKLKNLLRAKPQVQQTPEQTPDETKERSVLNSDPASNWDAILNDQRRRISKNHPQLTSDHPQPMSDVGTPTRNARDENSIPKSLSQWKRAFKTISENKKTETKNSPTSPQGDTGSDYNTHRIVRSGSQMEFWGAEGFWYSSSPDIAKQIKEDVWTMSS